MPRDGVADIERRIEQLDKAYQDEEVLRYLYHERDMTTREIAERFPCTHGAISDWLNKHDIDTRPNWKAGVEAAAEANRVPRARLAQLDSGYEYWQTRATADSDKQQEMVYVHRLLAVAEFGFDAVCGMDVHHENNIPWDNRPENLELMTKAQHQNFHREGKVYDGQTFVDPETRSVQNAN